MKLYKDLLLDLNIISIINLQILIKLREILKKIPFSRNDIM